jgi:hypothetical protein
MKSIHFTPVLLLAIFYLWGGSTKAIAEPLQLGTPRSDRHADTIDPDKVRTSEHLATNSTVLESRPSSLRDALLGEWVTNGGRTQYYFTPDQVTVVNQFSGDPLQLEPGLQQGHQVTQVMTYEVMVVNDTSSVVRLRIATPLNWAAVRTLQFSPNRQTLTELLEIPGQDLSSEWTYVGQQQLP